MEEKEKSGMSATAETKSVDSGLRRNDKGKESGGEEHRAGKLTDWIQTYTGKKFYPLEPDAEEICIEDIAHALSNICRFTGHCKRFYSVAEHSLLGAMWLEKEGYDSRVVLGFLLHDASEAYLCDVPRPLKKAWPWYREKEKALQEMIYDKYLDLLPKFDRHFFDLPIRETDNDMLFWEACELMDYLEHKEVWKTTFSGEDFERFAQDSYTRFMYFARDASWKMGPPTAVEIRFLEFFKRLRKEQWVEQTTTKAQRTQRKEREE